jgi:hypothetical protein
MTMRMQRAEYFEISFRLSVYLYLNGINKILINMKNKDVNYLLFDSAAKGKGVVPRLFS